MTRKSEKPCTCDSFVIGSAYAYFPSLSLFCMGFYKNPSATIVR